MKTAFYAAAAAAALAIAPAAQAATTITLLQVGNSYTGGATASHVSGSFFDEYVFSPSPLPDSIGDVGVFTIFGSAGNTVELTSFIFNGNELLAAPVILTPLGGVGFVNAFIPGGAHTLSVAGNILGVNGTYTIGANFNAVPEPATWAMMVAGIAAVGVAMRRRSQTTRVAFS